MTGTYKTKSLESLQEKMEDLDQGSMRYHVLESAKNFKTSWIELGRALYTVWKDKLYKDWGYGNFDIYTTREIGIRKQTALKLLKSYYFLEKEEPVYLKGDNAEVRDAALVPSFEAVDALRLAKNNKVLDAQDYAHLKREVFEKGKDAREVKKNLSVIVRERQELEPEEAQEKKKIACVRRLVGTLRSIKQEVEILKLLPAPLVKEVASLISKLEEEIG